MDYGRTHACPMHFLTFLLSPAAEQIMSTPELYAQVVAVADVEESSLLASTSYNYRDAVVKALRLRVAAQLAPFLHGTSVEEFQNMLHSIGGVVLGHVAEEAAHHDDQEWDQPRAPDGNTYNDLCLVVPGPDALGRSRAWFQERGYNRWRGRRVSSGGEVTEDTDFVVGAAGWDGSSEVCPPELFYDSPTHAERQVGTCGYNRLGSVRNQSDYDDPACRREFSHYCALPPASAVSSPPGHPPLQMQFLANQCAYYTTFQGYYAPLLAQGHF